MQRCNIDSYQPDVMRLKRMIEVSLNSMLKSLGHTGMGSASMLWIVW